MTTLQHLKWLQYPGPRILPATWPSALGFGSVLHFESRLRFCDISLTFGDVYHCCFQRQVLARMCVLFIKKCPGFPFKAFAPFMYVMARASSFNKIESDM